MDYFNTKKRFLQGVLHSPIENLSLPVTVCGGYNAEKKEKKIVKKITEDVIKKRIEDYFNSRKIKKMDQDGQVLLGKGGEILYEEKPCTVTGLALALGFSDRDRLFDIENRKIKNCGKSAKSFFFRSLTGMGELICVCSSIIRQATHFDSQYRRDSVPEQVVKSHRSFLDRSYCGGF